MLGSQKLGTALNCVIEKASVLFPQCVSNPEVTPWSSLSGVTISPAAPPLPPTEGLPELGILSQSSQGTKTTTEPQDGWVGGTLKRQPRAGNPPLPQGAPGPV